MTAFVASKAADGLAPVLMRACFAHTQTNKAQLSASVASQVDAARSGLELLDSAQKTLKTLQQCYQVPLTACLMAFQNTLGSRASSNPPPPGAQVIDRLCTECSSLIEHHEKIQVLSAVHYNLGKTLQDVENIAALPNEAAEAEELLCDDTNLLQARLLLDLCR